MIVWLPLLPLHSLNPQFFSLWVSWETIELDTLFFAVTVGAAYRTTTRRHIFRFCFLPYTIFSHDCHVPIIAVTPTEAQGLYDGGGGKKGGAGGN